MILKQYKLNLEFSFEITEITEFLFRSRLKRFANYEELIKEPGVREQIEHQRNLLQALLDNPEVLHKGLMKLNSVGCHVRAHPPKQLRMIIPFEFNNAG